MWHQFRCSLVLLILSLSEGQAGADSRFPSGVMSGDVTDSSAICWTQTDTAQALRVEVATDGSFSARVVTATLTTDASADFTAKYDVTGLRAGRRYFFRFVRTADGIASPTGEFRTAPEARTTMPLRFVFTGDSNARHRPFRVMDFAAAEYADLWFWYGDTIYGDVPATRLGAASTLEDYRAKYRQNLSDEALQTMLSRAAVWTGWDDHEVANDYDGGDPEPTLTRDQVDAAYQAFFEHMPIRPQPGTPGERRIYRSVRYGTLAEFFILDGRQYRSADAARVIGGELSALDPYGYFIPYLRNHDFIRTTQDPRRTMLGAAQRAWLKQAVIGSGARYKFIINPVPFSSLLVYPQDRWDGYDAERYDLLRALDLAGVEGVVILTTDSHANIVNPDVTEYLRTYLRETFSDGFGPPEFIAGPIATDTLGQEARGLVASLLGGGANPFADIVAGIAEGLVQLRVMAANKMAFADADHYGYLVVDVSEAGVTLTHRGIAADDANASPELRDLNRTTLDERGRVAAGPPCFLLPLIGLACLHGWVARTQRRRDARDLRLSREAGRNKGRSVDA